MGGSSISDGSVVRLEWRAELAGFVATLLTFVSLYFLYTSLHPEALSDDGRHAGLVRLLKSASVGRFGVGFLALYLFIAWAAVQQYWQAFEKVAAVAGPRGIRLHGMFGGLVAWDEVESVRRLPGTRSPSIEIRFRRPARGLFNPVPRRRHVLAGLRSGQVDAFVDAAAANLSSG